MLDTLMSIDEAIFTRRTCRKLGHDLELAAHRLDIRPQAGHIHVRPLLQLGHRRLVHLQHLRHVPLETFAKLPSSSYLRAVLIPRLGDLCKTPLDLFLTPLPSPLSPSERGVFRSQRFPTAQPATAPITRPRLAKPMQRHLSQQLPLHVVHAPTSLQREVPGQFAVRMVPTHSINYRATMPG